MVINPYGRGLYTHYKDSLLGWMTIYNIATFDPGSFGRGPTTPGLGGRCDEFAHRRTCVQWKKLLPAPIRGLAQLNWDDFLVMFQE